MSTQVAELRKTEASERIDDLPGFLHPENARLVQRLVKKDQLKGVVTGREASDPYTNYPDPDGNLIFDGFGQLILADQTEPITEEMGRITRPDLGLQIIRGGGMATFAFRRDTEGKPLYDFRLFREEIEAGKQAGVTVILDAQHFGWHASHHAETPETPFFQNPRFPEDFAEYIYQLVLNSPDINHLNLCNEPDLMARWSALNGIWNEQRSDDRSFVTAATNIAKGIRLARQRLDQLKQEGKLEELPIYWLNFSLEKEFGEHHWPRRFNRIVRWIMPDLIFGHDDPAVRHYALANGMSPEDYEWFMSGGEEMRKELVVGLDHYHRAVRDISVIEKDIIVRPHTLDKDPQIFEAMALEFHDRYAGDGKGRLVLAHTEVNEEPGADEQVVSHAYETVLSLINRGVAILPFITYYGLKRQLGWAHALNGEKARLPYDVGILDEKGRLKPIGKLLAELNSNGFPQEVIDKLIANMQRHIAPSV